MLVSFERAREKYYAPLRMREIEGDARLNLERGTEREKCWNPLREGERERKKLGSFERERDRGRCYAC